MNETKVTNQTETKKTVPVPSKQATVKALISKYQGEIMKALPQHIRPDHFIRTALTCILKTPALLECSQASLIATLLTAAQLGLNPDGILGEAYLIPYNNSVQLIPGYRGLINLAYRSGQIKTFEVRAVFEGDEFSYCFGLNPKLVHIPSPKSSDLQYVYAVVNLNNGGFHFDVMSKDEVEYIRNTSSKAKNSPAWRDHYVEMAKKTVIRRMSKMMQLSVEYSRAIGLDESAELGKDQKNSRELVNFDMPEFKDDIEEAISEDIAEEKEQKAVAKEEVKATKVDAAVQETLDNINKKVQQKREVATPITWYEEFVLAVKNTDGPLRLDKLRKEINSSDKLHDDEKFELDKAIETKLKELGGAKCYQATKLVRKGGCDDGSNTQS